MINLIAGIPTVHGVLPVRIDVLLCILVWVIGMYILMTRPGASFHPSHAQKKGRAAWATGSLGALVLGIYLWYCSMISGLNIALPMAMDVMEIGKDYNVVCRWNLDKVDHQQWQYSHGRLMDSRVLWRKALTDEKPHPRVGADIPCNELPTTDSDQEFRDLHAIFYWRMAAMTMMIFGVIGISWYLLADEIQASLRRARMAKASS